MINIVWLDDDLNSIFLKSYIAAFKEEESFKTTFVCSIKDFLKNIKKEPFEYDVLILDIMMPNYESKYDYVTTGSSFYENEIKKKINMTNTKVIVFTNLDDENSEAWAAQNKIPYIQKLSKTPNQLVEYIKKTCDEK